MKTFFLLFSAAFLVIQSQAQEKLIRHQYYKFESSCHILYTTSKSVVLTFFTDSSFSLEIFSNKRGGEQLYTRSEFSGKWNSKNDSIFFQYLHREIKAVTGNGANAFSSDQVIVGQAPIFCVVKEDVLATNSTFFDNLHVSKGKASALGEKWVYENAQRIATSPRKIIFQAN